MYCLTDTGRSLVTESELLLTAVSASSVGALILGILFGGLISACFMYYTLKRRMRKSLTISKSNIITNKEIDCDRHEAECAYEDMDTVRANYLELSENNAYGSPTEIGQNNGYGSPTELGKNDAYGSPTELGKNDAYESPMELSKNDAYGNSDDPTMGVYDND